MWVVSQYIDCINAKNYTILCDCKGNLLFITIGDYWNQVLGENAPNVREKILSFIKSKDFKTQSIKPRNSKFVNIHPRFCNDAMLMFVENEKPFKRKFCLGIENTPQITKQTLHLAKLDFPYLNLMLQVNFEF